MPPVATPNPQAVADVTLGAEDPVIFSLVIQKEVGESGLGVDVTYSCVAPWTRNGVLIAKVSEGGLVAEWNERSEEPHRVRPGDFIFQVNDVFGDIVLMIQEMKEKTHLTIHVLRRSTPPTLSASSREVPADAVQAPALDLPMPGMAQEGLSQAPSKESGTDTGSLCQWTVAEALLPRLHALGDEALAGLICIALERRPWLRDAVLEQKDGRLPPEGLPLPPPPPPPSALGKDADSSWPPSDVLLGDAVAAAAAVGVAAAATVPAPSLGGPPRAPRLAPGLPPAGAAPAASW